MIVRADPALPPSSMHDALSALGERYDAAPNFPADSLAVLVAHGLHRRFAPWAAGGMAGNEALRHAAMLEALRAVGRADLSVGRLYEGHVNALLLFGWYGTKTQIEWLSSALDRSAWFGVWATEPSPGVRIADDGSNRLTGDKSFASGAGGLTHALITAATGSERRLVIIPADDAARADTSDWRVRGMRASVSGRYDVDELCVDEVHLLGAPGDYDREPRFTAGAWRFCAVQLGGIEALLSETRVAMGDPARADPVRRARFADAVAAARTAGFWVAEAAKRAAEGSGDAVAIVQMTRGVVERAALDVMEISARLIGTRSAFDGQRVDKIIRDLSLYLRQGGPDHARDQAALAWLDRDPWTAQDRLW